MPVEMQALESLEPLAYWLAGIILVSGVINLIPRRERRPADREEADLRFRGPFLLLLMVALGAVTWVYAPSQRLPVALILLATAGLGSIAVLVTLRHKPERSYGRATKRNWMRLSPNEFEQHVAKVFQSRGYHARVVGQTADGGVDVLLRRNRRRGIVQCKRYKSSIGVSTVREFAAVLDRSKAREGYLVVSSTFTSAAQEWADYEGIRLIDGDTLSRWDAEMRRKSRGKDSANPLYFSLGGWLTLLYLVVVVVALALVVLPTG